MNEWTLFSDQMPPELISVDVRTLKGKRTYTGFLATKESGETYLYVRYGNGRGGWRRLLQDQISGSYLDWKIHEPREIWNRKLDDRV